MNRDKGNYKLSHIYMKMHTEQAIQIALVKVSAGKLYMDRCASGVPFKASNVSQCWGGVPFKASMVRQWLWWCPFKASIVSQWLVCCAIQGRYGEAMVGVVCYSRQVWRCNGLDGMPYLGKCGDAMVGVVCYSMQV